VTFYSATESPSTRGKGPTRIWRLELYLSVDPTAVGATNILIGTVISLLPLSITGSLQELYMQHASLNTQSGVLQFDVSSLMRDANFVGACKHIKDKYNIPNLANRQLKISVHTLVVTVAIS